MLPEGWQRLPLREVAEIRTGVAKGKTNFRDPVELPYLRVANVQDGYLDLSEVKSIFVERDQVERYSLQVGDILMTEGGDFDKLGRGDVWQDQIPVCLHQNHVFAVRPQKERLDSSFLAALAASQHGRSYFLSCAKRSTNLASINSSQLKAFPVVMPPLAEQRLITTALATWDNAIVTAERLLANSGKQKQALIAALLTGKRRCTNHRSPWRQIALEDACTFHKGGGLSKSDVSDTGKSQCILYGELFTTYGEVIDRVVSRTNTSSGFLAMEGDVLIPTATTTVAKDLATASALLIDNVRVGGDAIVMRPNKEVLLPEFLAYVLTYSKRREIASLGQGATIVHLSTDNLRDLDILVPSVSEQGAISDVLRSGNIEIAAIKRQIDSLHREKSVLMQQLLTGKRRVRLPKEAVEAASA